MTVHAFDPRWLAVEGIFGGFVLGRIVDAAGAVDGFAPQAIAVRSAADPAPWGAPRRWPAVPPQPRLPYSEHLEVRPVGTAALDGGAAAWVRFARPLASRRSARDGRSAGPPRKPRPGLRPQVAG